VYQSLDLTVGKALEQRSADFPGIVICTASDSLGTLLQLIKRRRVHRLVVVEGEVGILTSPDHASNADIFKQDEERKGGKKGRLLGVITLSDVLRYLIGEAGLTEQQPSPLPPQSETPRTEPPASPIPPPPASPEPGSVPADDVPESLEE
jgi:5'-AMP-activated protein kinase regulatory gamma subunit